MSVHRIPADSDLHPLPIGGVNGQSAFYRGSEADLEHFLGFLAGFGLVPDPDDDPPPPGAAAPPPETGQQAA